MDWPSIATFDGPPPTEPLILDARDGDTATYQPCTDPGCPATKPDTQHAHLISVDRPKEQQP